MFEQIRPINQPQGKAPTPLFGVFLVLFLLAPLPVWADDMDSGVLEEVPVGYMDSYRHLIRSAPDLNPSVLTLGLRAFAAAEARGQARRKRLTIIDYSLPSTHKRLWVIDLERDRLIFHELVAHGRNSGVNESTQFSNIVGSRQSSLGTFLTAETYRGKHGYSLRLDGVENGINHKARERAIVMHGADYVSTDFVARHGRLGRSWGCPAVSRAVAATLIDAIKDGSVIFAYYPDPVIQAKSAYLNDRYQASGS